MKRASLPKIQPPVYRIGRCVLNEYELRCLMAEVAQGKRPRLVEPVTCPEGHVAYMREDGRFAEDLSGLDISGRFTLDMIRSDQESGRTAARAQRLVEKKDRP